MIIMNGETNNECKTNVKSNETKKHKKRKKSNDSTYE